MATVAWPRSTDSSSGRRGSEPNTSASMVSGTAAMGSTRPRMRSNSPTMSSPGRYKSRNHETDTFPDGRPKRVFERTPMNVTRRIATDTLTDGRTTPGTAI